MIVRRLIATIAFLMALAASGSIVRADSPDPAEAARRVAEGNRLLGAGKTEDALKEYDAAALAQPDSPEVAYNRGLALYRLNKFDEAGKAFQGAVRPGRPELEAKAKYNLGRSAHAAAQAAAESQTGDDQTAIGELAKAIRYYDEALQLAPNDADAKHNRDLAERMIRYIERRVQKKKEEQKKNQPSSQPSSQPNQQNQDGDQNSPSSQPSSQPTTQPKDQQSSSQPSSQPNDAKQSEDKDGDDPKDADKDASGEDKDKDKDQKDSEARARRDAGKPGEMRKMTKEEAERYLQQARDAEAKRRKLRRQMEIQQRGRIPVDKDW